VACLLQLCMGNTMKSLYEAALQNQAGMIGKGCLGNPRCPRLQEATVLDELAAYRNDI
jgi:hypothetical protein